MGTWAAVIDIAAALVYAGAIVWAARSVALSDKLTGLLLRIGQLEGEVAKLKQALDEPAPRILAGFRPKQKEC